MRDARLDEALRRATARGVRLRAVIADWQVDNAEGVEQVRELASIPGAEVRLSAVPDWSGGYIPFARVEDCKYMGVDSL